MTRRIAAVVTALLFAALAAPVHAEPAPDPTGGAANDAPANNAPAANDPDEPNVILVTMGVGALIWERHGHIALCVEYRDHTRDACYNYGIGDFHHPIGMAWGFLRGTGSFWVGKSSVGEMLSIYKYADRTIWAQPLPLSREEKRKVIDKLEYDILEDHKYYAYDHFWDNCTTRVRDVINTATGGKLSAMTESTGGRTFRDLAREGFFGVQMPEHVPDTVPLLITDIAMGRVTDRPPTYYERMFLPQYLREAVTKLWGVQPSVVYERKGPPAPSDGPSGRAMLALFIIGITSPAWITRLIGRAQRAGLAIAVVPYLVLGTVLTGVAILSPLPYIRWNETCLVLLPLDVLVLVLPEARRRGYARARIAMLAVLLVLQLVGVLTQPLLAELLWPAIPLAVVGFWPARASRVGQIDSADPAAAPRGRPRRKR